MAAATTPGAHSSPHTFQILVLLSSRRYFVIFIFLHNFNCISKILFSTYIVILTHLLHLNCIRVIIYFPLSYLHLIVKLL